MLKIKIYSIILFSVITEFLQCQNITLRYVGNEDESISVTYLFSETGNSISVINKENRILIVETKSPQFINCIDINRFTSIYAEPNETIDFKITKKGLVEYYCKKSPIRSSESKFINELFEKYGSTETSYVKKIKLRASSLNKDKPIIFDDTYRNENLLLEEYYSKGKISKEFYKYFKSMLWSLTIDNKIHNPQKQHDGIMELQKSLSNPNELLNICEYRSCLLSYTYFEMQKSKTKYDLYSTLQFMSTHFTNQSIIDYLSYSKIKTYILQSRNKVDSKSLNLFYTICKNKQFTSEIKTDFSQNMKSVFLKNIIEKSGCKLAIIDFWASWCKPCLEELPYSKMRIKEYPQVKYIFVSIDKSKSAWIKETQKKTDLFNSSNSYLISEIKDKDFLNKIKITTIPRFVLLNSKGEIVDTDFPRPSDPNFKTAIAEKLKHTK